MNKRIEMVDIEKSISQVFKYKFYKEEGLLPISILEDGEIVNLSGYEANVFFKFSNNNVISFYCPIVNNVVEVPLEKEYFITKEKIPFEIVFTNGEQRVTTFKMYLDI